jgi:hypothetical protein
MRVLSHSFADLLTFMADDYKLPVRADAFLAGSRHPAHRWHTTNAGKHFLLTEKASRVAGRGNHHDRQVLESSLHVT